MATLEQIQAKLEKLKAQSDALTAKQSTAAIEKIRELMSEHGLTISDIGGQLRNRSKVLKSRVTSTGVAKPSAVVYKDPKTGATWSGRGRAPNWIASAKSRDKFLVDSTEAAPTAKVTNKTATDNYLRGPQAAKYANPKTGATWSGRGRAPAWIADAKDREKFLIDDANLETAAVETSAPSLSPRKAAIKKVATKKAATKKAATKKAATKKAATKKAATKKAATKKAVARKAVARKAQATEESVTAKKAVAKKSSVAEKQAAGKKSGVTPAKRPTVKKAVATKSVRARTNGQSAETVDASQTSEKLSV